MTQKIVIIGNGIAALSAIKSIRENDKQSEIHLIGDEKFYPYNRVRLSKGQLSTLEEDKILLQKKDWYKNNEITLYIGNKVVSVDTAEKSVSLSEDKNLPYDKLLIANGSRSIEPSIPGIEKTGVYTFKTLLDVQRLTNDLANIKNVLFIGGGIQGLEAAWILSELGKNVILSHRSSRLMRKELDEEASTILRTAVEDKGIKILFNSQIREIIGRDRVEGFITADGESYDCDAVIYSIGTKPNIDILKGTDIDTHHGVIVNNRMETSVRDIYAAGDVAEFNHKVYGLWNIAIGQGKTAGYSLSGKDNVYTPVVPVITLSAFNLSLFSMGEIENDKAAQVFVERSGHDYIKIYFKNGQVVGAIVVGDIKSSPALKTAIEKEMDLGPIDYKNISFNEIIKRIKESK